LLFVEEETQTVLRFLFVEITCEVCIARWGWYSSTELPGKPAWRLRARYYAEGQACIWKICRSGAAYSTYQLSEKPHSQKNTCHIISEAVRRLGQYELTV